MRRTISILLAALVAFGCAKEELAVIEPSRTGEASGRVGMTPISISLEKRAENWGTKAGAVNGFAVNDKVTVAAFQNDNECFNDAVTNTASGWVMSEGHHYYWESYNAEYNGTDALDFCFVYPQQTINDRSFTYTLSADPAAQKDLLVKYLSGTQASADYSPVSVEMDHALSILGFKVKAEESGYEYKVEGITVNNAAGFYDKGTYTFGSGWGSQKKANNVTAISSPVKVATVTSNDYTDVNAGDYCFLLPQTVTSMTANVIYSVEKNGKTYKKAIETDPFSENFEAGKRYTYKITLPKIKTPLSAPTGLTATPDLNQFSVSWNNVSDATSYYVTWKLASGGDTSSKTVSTNSCTITDLASGTEYTITVVAKADGFNDSDGTTGTFKTKEETKETIIAWNKDVPSTGGTTSTGQVKGWTPANGDKIQVTFCNFPSWWGDSHSNVKVNLWNGWHWNYTLDTSIGELYPATPVVTFTLKDIESTLLSGDKTYTVKESLEAYGFRIECYNVDVSKIEIIPAS